MINREKPDCNPKTLTLKSYEIYQQQILTNEKVEAMNVCHSLYKHCHKMGCHLLLNTRDSQGVRNISQRVK